MSLSVHHFLTVDPSARASARSSALILPCADMDNLQLWAISGKGGLQPSVALGHRVPVRDDEAFVLEAAVLLCLPPASVRDLPIVLGLAGGGLGGATLVHLRQVLGLLLPPLLFGQA